MTVNVLENLSLRLNNELDVFIIYALLRADGGITVVETVEVVTDNESETTYNIEVSNTHNYYVEVAFLVHNASTTAAGIVRDNPGMWKQYMNLWEGLGMEYILSDANRAKIADRKVPTLDKKLNKVVSRR